MRTRTKATVLVWAVVLFGGWICLEGLSLLAYAILDHSAFSYAKALGKLDASISASSSEGSLPGVSGLKWTGNIVEVLHPYFGFVADPCQSDPALRISKFGFLESDQPSPILKRSPEKVIVALFGGSFSRLAYPVLKAVFDQHSATLGKKFVFINFAADGYKQPQQLMVLNYFLALGAQFDLVINLDGFNEVALPPAENIPYHVNPFYPWKWDRRTAKAIDPTLLRLIGSAEVWRAARESWAQLVGKHHLYLSPTLFLVWQTRDKMLAREIYETSLKIKAEGAKDQSYTATGPAYTFDKEDQLYHDLAEFCKRCSMQMNALCAASGAGYYDFLQPNQYVKDSKPMSDEEKSQALNHDSRFAEGATEGYPFLQKAGRELQSSGVRFTDLTMVFAGHPEILYIDDCCHTNRAGYDIVANRIYETIYPK